jgi:AcrR family transcriptional regulator
MGVMTELVWRKKGARKKGAKSEKRKLLLETAARMFNEAGFERTSLNDIADELGITKPSLYYYVKNKEEILFLINKSALDGLKDAFKKIDKHDIDKRAQLTEVLTEYIKLVKTDFGKCLVTSNKMALSEESRSSLRKSFKFVDHAVRTIINEGVADGSLVTASPKLTTFAIFGALNWMCYWYQEGAGNDSEDIAKHFVDVFLKGLDPRS